MDAAILETGVYAPLALYDHEGARGLETIPTMTAEAEGGEEMLRALPRNSSGKKNRMRILNHRSTYRIYREKPTKLQKLLYRNSHFYDAPDCCLLIKNGILPIYNIYILKFRERHINTSCPQISLKSEKKHEIT